MNRTAQHVDKCLGCRKQNNFFNGCNNSKVNNRLKTEQVEKCKTDVQLCRIEKHVEIVTLKFLG